MRTGRAKAEKNLQRFSNQAKEFLKLGQKDKAKKELTKKKKREEKIKSFDTQFNVILEKIKEVKNSTQMVQVLNATKYCNNLLLAELSEKETGEPTDGMKEYQDLLENDKEITKYLETIVKSKRPEKVKPSIPQPNQFNNNNININQNINISDNDLALIQKCGFNSFGDITNKINELLGTMRTGRNKANINLEKYVNQAKNFLRDGQKLEAKKELTKKKAKEEKIKAIDTMFVSINEKMSKIKSSKEILEILKDIKSCNNLIMVELSQNEEGEEMGNINEYQGLEEIDKEISKYLDIIGSSGNYNDINYPSDSI
jgi:phage shock protein A